MGKRSKGVDAVISKNMLKKSMLTSCKKYAEQLERENYALKNDPSTVIGQFIGQFRELYSQNQRLSTLSACLIKKLNDSVVLTKEEMESYNGKRINIKWEIAEGETLENAKEYTFTYELQDAPPQGQPVQATETPGAEAVPHECTDENCQHGDVPHEHAEIPVYAEEEVIANAEEVIPVSEAGATSGE